MSTPTPFHLLNVHMAQDRNEAFDRYDKARRSAVATATAKDPKFFHPTDTTCPEYSQLYFVPWTDGDPHCRQYCFDICAETATINVLQLLFSGDAGVASGWVRFVIDDTVPEGKIEFAFRWPAVQAPVNPGPMGGP